MFDYTIKSPTEKTLASIKQWDTFEIQVTSLLRRRLVTNENDYNATLRMIKKLSTLLKIPNSSSATFTQERKLIQKKKPLTETTSWGGVALKKVDVANDFIQKLLVIKKYGVLGFEIHKMKQEHLTILEGFCLVFWINHARKTNHTIAIQLAGPGDKFDFALQDEHGILTLTNCIIEETSTNHLDDLVYIYHAHL